MSKNIRIAQFGGIGGGGSGSPYAPGKSPIGAGGYNNGGNGINVNWDEEQTLEKMLTRLHEPMDESERNFETRLTQDHKHVEEDLRGYLLTPEERLREKQRRELHNYKTYMEEAAKRINNNSVSYINEHYQPKEEHVTTLENSLSKRRHFDDSKIVRHKYEDQTPDQEKPSRIHPVLSDSNLNRIAKIVMRNKLTEENDADVEERNIFDDVRFKTVPMGRTPVLLHGNELDEYFSKLMQEAAPNDEGQRENANTDTIFTEADPDYNPSFYPRKEIANEPADDGVNSIDLFVSLEQNLNPSKTPKNRFDRNNMGGEDMGLEETYPGSVFFGIHTPASFQ